MSMAELNPWPNRATAVAFLRMLINDPPVCLPNLPPTQLAPWLIHHELAPLAYYRFQAVWPELCQQLQADWYAVTAENHLHLANVILILNSLAAHQIPGVLLKGAALAHTVYPDPACRPMSDIDLWVDANQLAQIVSLLTNLGFYQTEKEERPFALQRLAGGELRFQRPDWQHGLVEVHLSPMPGWWLYYTAVPDILGLWNRRQPCSLSTTPPLQAEQLAPEDMLLQVATHIAINHQLGGMLSRALLDMSLIMATYELDWEVIAQRATSWRIATAVYMVLHLTHHLFNQPTDPTLYQPLRPPLLRWRLLERFFPPDFVLDGVDLRTSLRRLALLTLLVDRPQDRAKLIARTLWPEPEWRTARYGRPVSGWYHLRQLLRQRAI